ncbi:MAG: hypothetical protein K0S98_288 [Propionibacteriaceae bacterium]|nr:hypothetical protein [Propionibacteriaceae bacterium]
MRRVYLSYRREDSERIAQQLTERLAEHFEVVAPAAEPESAVPQAYVVVAVIDARWTDIMGQPRSDSSSDRVSAEIAAALRRGVLVIPVLIDGARMPTRTELPDALAELAGKRAVIVGADSFTSDSSQLISSIERRVPEVHREPSSGENKDALRQRRITELHGGIRAAAETGDWQTVLNLGSELTSLGPANDDPDGLVTMARQRLAEARRRRLNSNPELGIEPQAARPLKDANDEAPPQSSSGVTPVEESPPPRFKSAAVPLVVLVVAILVVVLVLFTI